jgi:hypothetical protein
MKKTLIFVLICQLTVLFSNAGNGHNGSKHALFPFDFCPVLSGTITGGYICIGEPATLIFHSTSTQRRRLQLFIPMRNELHRF